jgi:hypothetical protein
MRSIALRWISMAAVGTAGFAVVMADMIHVPAAFPTHHVRIALTLARVLIQL